MFELEKHRREYIYDMYTVVPDVLPRSICEQIANQVDREIDCGNVHFASHSGKGTEKELDYGGSYHHHVFLGDDIRRRFPVLVGVYQGLTNLLSVITSNDVITSPHLDSDINIKAYPYNGGQIGWHKDTNGITCLIYFTDNEEGNLVLELERELPWLENPTIEVRRIKARAGQMLLMQGRKIRHMSEPMVSERKIVGVFNYYSDDTWRPQGFDEMVYNGQSTKEVQK